MARKRVQMEKIRDIIRYRVITDLSKRQISRALKVSRTAVSKHVSLFYIGSGGILKHP